MTFIWERLLRRRAIGADENFFVLGGDRDLADELFAEIEARSGRTIPSAAIDYAPTIGALDGVLCRAAMPAYSPLVLMKPGSMQSPVFVVHALGGSIGELYPLVSYLKTEQAIYGIEGRGIDGLEEPQAFVEDMAALYLNAIERVHPCGPYLLIGYSLGGLIAFEMARQSSAVFRRAASLTMVDAVIPGRYLSFKQRVDLTWKRVQYHRREMQNLPFPAPYRYIKKRLRLLFGLAPDPREAARQAAECRPLSFACAWNRVAEKGYAAMAVYRPGFFQGSVRYVSAAGESLFLPCSPESMWKPLVAQLDIEILPGSHLNLIHGCAPALGAILTRHIREALGPR